MTTWADITADAETIAETISGLAPLAAVAGPEGAAIGILISKGAAYVAAALSAAQTGVTALGAISTGDLAKIQAADTALQTQNQALALRVADS